MSTYTPCFPPTGVTLSGRGRPNSSNSSGTSTSTSGSHAPIEVTYSARLSRSYLALASVSEYLTRPPSPTSAAVDAKRITRLRRKFRLAIDATYRDTSSGKWAHVSEIARLGSTRGRWQGTCSGSSAPYSLYKAHEQKHQESFPHLEAGIAAESADPYPRPPIVSDLREIRERVENWQADVSSTPISQVHGQDPALNRSTHVGGAEKPSPLNFPIVKKRRSGVSKAMKPKDNPSRKGRSTSRYFRGIADPQFPDSEGVNRDTEGVTTSPSEPRGSNVGPTSHSREGALGEDSDTARRGIPTSDTAPGQQNIQQVSELFLPPSFPSHLRTSTPPPLLTAKSTYSRLTKPPEIPRNEDPCFSASLPSPLPFPLSQAIEGSQGFESQPNGLPSLSRHKRLLPDTSSPTGSTNRLSKRWRQSPSFDKPTPPPNSSLNELHDDVRRHDRDVSSRLSTPEHVPVIDLRQLMSSQRSRTTPRHPLHGISPMTPRAEDKGKGRALTLPHLRTPAHSQTNFTQDADAFAPVAESTQPPLAKGIPHVDGAFAISLSSQIDVEAYAVSDALGRDFAAWVADVPVLEGSQEYDPERASQALAPHV